MKLNQLPNNVSVFVDASIFIYHLTGHDTLAQACTTFFERAVLKEITAVTSVVVAMEVIHRVILLEASTKLSLRGGELVTYLKKHPGFVQELVQHRTVPSIIRRLGVSIEPITHLHVHNSRQARQEYGFMANDSLIIAFMDKHNITHLATNDNDFQRVMGIKVWRPQE